MRVVRWHEDRGSLPMAMLAVIIVGALVTVVTATVVVGQRQTRFDQTFEQSLQRAETGVDRLAHLVRQNQIESFLEGQDDPTTPSIEEDGYWADAEQEDNGTWVITGEGTVGDVTRRVVLRMTGQALFPFAMMTQEGVHMPGNPRHVNSYHSGNNDWGGGAGTGNGVLATNADLGNIKVHGEGPPWNDGLEYEIDIDIDSDPAVQFIHDACDPEDASPLTLSGNDTLAPGDYCVSDLTFAGEADIELDGASLENPVRLYVTGSISFGKDVTVNCGDGCIPGSDHPEAGALQVYTASESQVSLGNRLTFAGAIFAPRAHCLGGPHARIFGALTCRTAGQFPGHFRLHYDDALGDLQGAFRGQWLEEGSG